MSSLFSFLFPSGAPAGRERSQRRLPRRKNILLVFLSLTVSIHDFWVRDTHDDGPLSPSSCKVPFPAPYSPFGRSQEGRPYSPFSVTREALGVRSPLLRTELSPPAGGTASLSPLIEKIMSSFSPPPYTTKTMPQLRRRIWTPSFPSHGERAALSPPILPSSPPRDQDFRATALSLFFFPSSASSPEGRGGGPFFSPPPFFNLHASLLFR